MVREKLTGRRSLEWSDARANGRGSEWATAAPQPSFVDATVLPATKPGAMVYTDDWNGYKPLNRNDRGHATVNHSQVEFARDDDGDGVREVHCNTLEGIWTGLRNFLRPLRGVNTIYLEQYVIMFEWAHNLKTVTDQFLRILLGSAGTTKLVT